MIEKYWTIHGLFYGTKTFYNYQEALAYFTECGSSWDSDEIRMVEHKVIHKKVNKKPRETAVTASDGEDLDMFRKEK